MNSYVNYIREISADDVLEGILGYGLFADQLPDNDFKAIMNKEISFLRNDI